MWIEKKCQVEGQTKDWNEKIQEIDYLLFHYLHDCFLEKVDLFNLFICTQLNT